MSTPEAKTVEVELIEEAVIVPRGEALCTWFVRKQRSWIKARDLPGVEARLSNPDDPRRSSPPGTVWQRRLVLEVPVGTKLLKLVTEPLVERLSVEDFFKKSKDRVLRKRRETIFEVKGPHRYERVKPERVSAVEKKPPAKRN